MSEREGRGFTLLEVAVAAAILAVLLAVVYAGYAIGVRSWERGEQVHDAVTELRLAGNFIRSCVEQTYPLTVSTGSGRWIQFEGEAQRLAFITSLPRYLGEGGLYEVVFAVDARETGADLSMARRALGGASRGQVEADRQRRLLVRDLTSVQFDYFGSVADGVPPTWHRRWHARSRLPRLVRVRLASRRVGDWPAIVIPVHAKSALPPAAAALSSARAAGTGAAVYALAADVGYAP